MAKISALVQTTSQFLVARNHAQMATLGICTVSDRTAHLFAVMLLAFLQLVTNALAL